MDILREEDEEEYLALTQKVSFGVSGAVAINQAPVSRSPAIPCPFGTTGIPLTSGLARHATLVWSGSLVLVQAGT